MHVRGKNVSNMEFFADKVPGELLDAAAPNPSVCFLAVRTSRGVAAFIADTRWDGWYGEFRYTLSPETDPCSGRQLCPQRILDLLDPAEQLYGPDEDWRVRSAEHWRQACRDRHARRAARPVLRPGQIVRFAEHIRFSGGEIRDTFLYQGRGRFAAARHEFTIRNWQEIPYEIIEPADDRERAWHLR